MTQPDLLECVINVSEGRDLGIVASLRHAGGEAVIDVHSDGDHNRSVFTLAGRARELDHSVRSVATVAVERLDLGRHRGAHPRIGVLDVVPWVSLCDWPLRDGSQPRSLDARDRFAEWAAATLHLPCFLYGFDTQTSPGRSLPEVRRHAWIDLAPDTGPQQPHPTAGAAAVGARKMLVAYNLWLGRADVAEARTIAAQLRNGRVRALGLAVGAQVQVSCNLIDPWATGPAEIFDAVAQRSPVARAELVGLIPEAVLGAIPAHRWPELDLDPSKTIEARLEQAGLDGGRTGARGR